MSDWFPTNSDGRLPTEPGCSPHAEILAAELEALKSRRDLLQQELEGLEGQIYFAQMDYENECNGEAV